MKISVGLYIVERGSEIPNTFSRVSTLSAPRIRFLSTAARNGWLSTVAVAHALVRLVKCAQYIVVLMDGCRLLGLVGIEGLWRIRRKDC